MKRAAFLSFGVAAVAGLILALASAWWLVLVGAVCVVAAWYYTGGERPYGYRGLGEVMVFVFFGLVAVVGTTFVQLGSAPLEAWWAGSGVGALACAILVANNLRDIPTDTVAGKRTLAVVLGDVQTRYLFTFLVVLAAVFLLGVLLETSFWAVLGLAYLVAAVPAARIVLGPATGPSLIPVLQKTGTSELLYAAGLFLGIAFA